MRLCQDLGFVVKCLSGSYWIFYKCILLLKVIRICISEMVCIGDEVHEHHMEAGRVVAG